MKIIAWLKLELKNNGATVQHVNHNVTKTSPSSLEGRNNKIRNWGIREFFQKNGKYPDPEIEWKERVEKKFKIRMENKRDIDEIMYSYDFYK